MSLIGHTLGVRHAARRTGFPGTNTEEVDDDDVCNPYRRATVTAYLGGVGTYRQKCEEEAAAGYPAFTRR